MDSPNPFVDELFNILDSEFWPILTEVPRPQDCARTQRRYLHHPIIDFRTNGWLGIRLSNALENNMEGLADPDSQVMVTPGVKVTYLIEWVGYSSMKKQMYSRRTQGVQCRSRIAKQIAKLVDDFVYERRNVTSEEAEWRVGPGFITLDRIYLMELRRISEATWRATLACEFE